MKRRELFKMLGTLAAVPFVAPLVAMCKPNEHKVSFSGRMLSAEAPANTHFLALKSTAYFDVGDVITIVGEHSTPSVITKVYRHGVDVRHGEQS